MIAHGAGSRLRIVVLGYIVRGPLGGLAWHHLQYVMGLKRLGHDVYFVEDSDDYPACYDPTTNVTGTDARYGLAFARNAFARVGLGGRWAYYDGHTRAWLGPAAGAMPGLCQSADVLLNVSGVNPLRPWLQAVPVRTLIDTDPVFTQVRHLTEPATRARAAQHTVFFSFGENIGRRDCTVPDDGFAWQPTRQPVVLDAWPITPGHPDSRFTSVMQWDSYKVREYGGRRYGMKSESFGPFLDLPGKCAQPLQLALGSSTAPRAALRRKGWSVINPLGPTHDPWTYQRYIQRSKGEFGIAKHGYVVSQSGWFSERSAAYLASGRPVVVQETGFSDWLLADAGVLAFSTPDEAVTALDQVSEHYSKQCEAARAVAEQYFDAERVLQTLLDRAMSPARVVALG